MTLDELLAACHVVIEESQSMTDEVTVDIARAVIDLLAADWPLLLGEQNSRTATG